MIISRGILKPMAVVLGIVLLGMVLFVLFITQPVFTRSAHLEKPLADSGRMRRDVVFLTAAPFRRSYPRVADLDRAADYIRAEFTATGARVHEQVYQVDADSYRNVIASFGPEHGPRVLVGAHYDSWGGMPGADDNASGTAGILELARLLNGQHLSTRVDLIAFTLEEPPFFRTPDMGSFRHARALREAGINVRGMICLEMIGYFADAPGSQSYPVGLLGRLYPPQADFIALVGSFQQVGLLRRVKRAMVSANTLPVASTNAPSAIPGIDFSDHWSYWQHDYPAVMVTDTAFYRNGRYHTPHDTAETLDYRRMGLVVDQVFRAVIDLVQ